MRFPHEADLAVIPFTFVDDEVRSSGDFALTPDLARPDGALYGGTGIAASVMAMEAATQRDALWVLTQFVAAAQVGSRLSWSVQTQAMGGRIAQLQVEARAGAQLVFSSLGATAHPRPGGLNGGFLPMPAASGPEDSPPLHRGAAEPAVDGEDLVGLAFRRHVEFREAELLDPSSSSMCLWARLRHGSPLTRAGLAFLADMIPVAVARAAGVQGAGFSLDNALRFGDLPPTEWVLLELRGELATNGYGHGSLAAWASDGTLVATGSQTANMTALWGLPPAPDLFRHLRPS